MIVIFAVRSCIEENDIWKFTVQGGQPKKRTECISSFFCNLIIQVTRSQNYWCKNTFRTALDGYYELGPHNRALDESF